MDNLITTIALWLGIDEVTLITILAMTVTICNLLGRFIPDSATGWLGTIRKVAKVVGLYIGNRITPRVTTNDVGRAIAASVPDSAIVSTADLLPAAIRAGVSASGLAASIVDAAQAGSLVPEQYRTDPFRSGADAAASREN